MGILDNGEGSAVPLGADYEHREEYRPPLWYRRGEVRNPFLRQKKSSGKGKGHTMGMVKGNIKATDVGGAGVGSNGNSQHILSAVRAGHGAGREIAKVTGLSIQMVGALLSRLSQAKVITKGADGRWVDLSVLPAKAVKPVRASPSKGTGLPDESALQQKILSRLGNNGLGASEVALLLGSKVPTVVLVMRRMVDAGLARKEGKVWMAVDSKRSGNNGVPVIPKPRRTTPVTHHEMPAAPLDSLLRVPADMANDQSPQAVYKPTVKDFAKDFARVMENSRKLNDRIGDTLDILQDIRAVNDALTAEWVDLQERLAALGKAS